MASRSNPSIGISLKKIIECHISISIGIGIGNYKNSNIGIGIGKKYQSLY